MGLLERALQYYSLEAEKKTAGLLAGVALYSKSLESTGLLPTGLLAKAERLLRESQREGLYIKAQRFGAAHVPRGMKVGKVGLLEKALRFAAESAFVEEEEVLTEGVRVPELEKVAAAAPAEVAEEPLPEKAASRDEVKEEEEAPEPEFLPQIFEELLIQGDPLELLKRFAEVVGSEGHVAFCTALLETCMMLGKGRSAFLITAQRRGYREDESVISDKIDLAPSGGRRRKISIGKSSKLIRHITEKRESVISLRSIKDEKVLEACIPLSPYKSWTVLPISLGEYLAGFILLGTQPKSTSMPREQLITLARLASFFIVPDVILCPIK